MTDVAAVDMFVVMTTTFRLLYTSIVLHLDRRRVVHFDVTQNPTQVWLSGQMTEAFPWETAPRHLLRDRDASYGPAFRNRVKAMDIEEVVIAPRSPWQNPFAERLIGSIRRECLDQGRWKMKIETDAQQGKTTVRLCGQFQAEHVAELIKQLQDNGPRLFLDLTEVTVVDVEVVRFFGACEANGVKVLHCPRYIREWMNRERKL